MNIAGLCLHFFTATIGHSFNIQLLGLYFKKSIKAGEEKGDTSNSLGYCAKPTQ